MRVFSFERSGDLMTVTARVWGAHGDRELVLVVDTGATATSVEPAILEGLGYSSRDAIMRTRVPSPAGVQHGHLFRVRRFHALGADLSGFVVQSLALADEYPRTCGSRHSYESRLDMNTRVKPCSVRRPSST
jgi:hypothetical protein